MPSVRATPFAKVDLAVTGPPLTVPSRTNDSGVQSGEYRTSALRMVVFSGTEARPSLVIVVPVSSVRTATSSWPTGDPLRKIV